MSALKLLAALMAVNGAFAVTTYTSDYFILTKPDNLRTGQVNEDMICEIPVAAVETITACEFITPNDTVWTVSGGQVLDGATPVPGYSAIDNGSANLTSWYCKC